MKTIIVMIIGACYMASLFLFKSNRYLLAAILFVIALVLALFARAVDNEENHYE